MVCVSVGCVSRISPMITSMKSTHEIVPFKHSVVRLYIYSSFMRNLVSGVGGGGVNIGDYPGCLSTRSAAYPSPHSQSETIRVFVGNGSKYTVLQQQ